MFEGWEKLKVRAELREKVSLYSLAGEFYLVRHFPFGFVRLDAAPAEALLENNSGELSVKLQDYINKKEPLSVKSGRVLRRLNLIIAQRCNCRCTYCYAGDGNYGADGIMSANIMKKAIDQALDGFDKVQSIQFFGGEPLLAPQLIEDGIAYAETGAQKRGKPVPSFSVVTNLTILPDNIFSLVKQGKLNILTSLDGPQKAHDRNRVFAGGAPTHETVVNNLRRLTPYAQPKTVEATFTDYHRSLGLTPMDVKKTILDICPNTSVAVIPVLSTEQDKAAEVAHSELAELWVSGKDPASAEVKKVVARYLSLVNTHARRDFFCDLGRENFTVDAAGRVWPCQVFCGKGKPLGEIGESWETLRGRFEAAGRASRTKSSLPSCRECFLRDYCTSCPGAWKEENGELVPSKNQCKADREAYLAALLLAFRAQKESVK